jgi:hypothetical protein
MFSATKAAIAHVLLAKYLIKSSQLIWRNTFASIMSCDKDSSLSGFCSV